MNKAFANSHYIAARCVATEVLYIYAIDNNLFTESEYKELLLMDDASMKKRERILEILESKPLPNLDHLCIEEELDIDTALAELYELGALIWPQ